MLFLQGRGTSSRNSRSCRPLVEPGRARDAASVEDADHSFHVPARTGRKDAEIRQEVADAMDGWIAGILAGAGR